MPSASEFHQDFLDFTRYFLYYNEVTTFVVFIYI